MVKQIIWSRLAHSNRLQILDYWLTRNGSVEYSIKLNKLFDDAVELISKHPRIGKETEMPGVRIKIIRDYYLTYRETDKTIEILTIWDSRQDPAKFERIIER